MHFSFDIPLTMQFQKFCRPGVYIKILGVQSDSKLLTKFLPNAGFVLLTLEHLGSSKPVTRDTSRDARVALGAAFNMNSKKTR